MKWENGSGMEIKKIERSDNVLRIELMTNMGDKKRYYTALHIDGEKSFTVKRIDYKDGSKRIYLCSNRYFKEGNEKKFTDKLLKLLKEKGEN